MVNAKHLFRNILRTHRRLPQEMRFVGDQYVRAEFRSHRAVTDKRFLEPFFTQWTSYLDLLKEQTRDLSSERMEGSSTGIGKHLDADLIERLDDDKAEQLLELHQASVTSEEEAAKNSGEAKQGGANVSNNASAPPKRA
ncbi:hypothetical protein BX661DRAFT_101207 [Kickxella alabastrina]|uniref:uncharacterized protein n=1 Tax=Kickxella alabastrina TaxID=61397 RepID=UPI00221F9C28|nr:uncharacterized protein BX661DRAFT_101207 [Kickxella alabastrina]KAI7829202.1 hypothetical protein BX661DRAFT_101207 [Kickxella alabastrina]